MSEYNKACEQERVQGKLSFTKHANECVCVYVSACGACGACVIATAIKGQNCFFFESVCLIVCE